MKCGSASCHATPSVEREQAIAENDGMKSGLRGRIMESGPASVEDGSALDATEDAEAGVQRELLRGAAVAQQRHAK